VSKTLDVPPEIAWLALISPVGLRLWLGDLRSLPMQKGKTFKTREGARGEIRAFSFGKAGSHVRLSWQPAGRAEPTILQVRAVPSGERTVISFHQERLSGPEEREYMRGHWKAVMNEIEALLG
jgi:uncharacterized protein YndB with AHSA1/START domain